MATHNKAFLTQIEQVSRPIWEDFLKSENITEAQMEEACDFTFKDFLDEMRLELATN